MFHFRIPYKNIGFRMSVDYIYIILFYKINGLYFFKSFQRDFWQVSVMPFLFTYYPSLWYKVSKNP